MHAFIISAKNDLSVQSSVLTMLNAARPHGSFWAEMKELEIYQVWTQNFLISKLPTRPG